ncbi:protein DEK-like [Anableps anableps]
MIHVGSEFSSGPRTELALNVLIPAAGLGEILQGKRTRKPVERFTVEAPRPTETLNIADGGGERLGEIPWTSFQVRRRMPEELKLLHSILFDRPGKAGVTSAQHGFFLKADTVLSGRIYCFSLGLSCD